MHIGITYVYSWTIWWKWGSLVTEPTEWCVPIVVTPKKNSEDICLCVDLSKLNTYVKRERYQSPTPREAVADIAAIQAKYFTTCDALSGYHQCPLAKDSQSLTPLLCPLVGSCSFEPPSVFARFLNTTMGVWMRPSVILLKHAK